MIRGGVKLMLNPDERWKNNQGVGENYHRFIARVARSMLWLVFTLSNGRKTAHPVPGTPSLTSLYLFHIHFCGYLRSPDSKYHLGP